MFFLEERGENLYFYLKLKKQNVKDNFAVLVQARAPGVATAALAGSEHQAPPDLVIAVINISSNI